MSEVIFYYDNQLKVEKVKINDKEGRNTLGIEQQIIGNTAETMD